MIFNVEGASPSLGKMNRIELYILNIKEHLRQPVDGYLTYFYEERRAAILRYRSPADRNRTLWAELLARCLIGARMGKPPREISIARDQRGKPYLLREGHEEGETPLEFSLSHSGPWVACSLGDAPSGVDVETDRRLTLNIAKRFFLREEFLSLETLLARDPKEGRRAFLRYWTLKESYAKCAGEDLVSALGTADCEALLRGTGRMAGRDFDLPGGAVLRVCAAPNALPERIAWVDWMDVSAKFPVDR